MSLKPELSSTSPKSVQFAKSEDQARYDYARLYRVEFSNENQVSVFKKLEQSDCMQFIGHAREPGQHLSILVMATRVPDVEDLLKLHNIKYTILVSKMEAKGKRNFLYNLLFCFVLKARNFQLKVDASYGEVRPPTMDISKFDWSGYHHLQDIYNWMNSLANKYPKIVTIIEMGMSTEGLPIQGVRICHPTNTTDNKPSIFIEAGIHAREWIAPAAATYLIHCLLESNDTTNVTNESLDMSALAKEFNWLIFPSVNPDGYKYSMERDRMWRKNRQLFETCFGVDLNRNFPYKWNTVGCSSIPGQFDYAGPNAASEKETQCVMKYISENVQKENIKTYIALHSYSQLIMFPYGDTRDQVPNYADLKEFSDKAVKAIHNLTGSTYKNGSLIETIYPSSGGSMDWAYAEQKIQLAYTFELRGPSDSPDLFLLPSAQILPTSQEALIAIKTIIESAKAKGYYN